MMVVSRSFVKVIWKIAYCFPTNHRSDRVNRGLPLGVLQGFRRQRRQRHLGVRHSGDRGDQGA